MRKRGALDKKRLKGYAVFGNMQTKGEAFFMAIIGVQTGGLTNYLSMDGVYRAVKEAGFDAVDANLDNLLTSADIKEKRRAAAFDSEGEESLQYFKPWKDAAEKYGVLNAQAHAPFPSYLPGEDEYNEYLMNVMEKTIAGCAYIGCSRLVIHPFFAPYQETVSAREEWENNMQRYARLIPAAKKYGVILCLENMFTRFNGKIYSACCSDFDVACRYIDELNQLAGEKRFGFCLDTGHCLLLGKDIRRVMEQLGERIEVFHIHDNNGVDDQHLAPYMGVLDWNRFVEGLRAIGYHGSLSFETVGAIVRAFDPALIPEVLRLIARTGRLFAERAGV